MGNRRDPIAPLRSSLGVIVGGALVASGIILIATSAWPPLGPGDDHIYPPAAAAWAHKPRVPVRDGHLRPV